MKNRYRVFRRKWGTYYCEDLVTKKHESLHTRDRDEAYRLIAARNETDRAPAFSLHLARVYWRAGDPAAATRTWHYVIDEMLKIKKGNTHRRWISAINDKAFERLLILVGVLVVVLIFSAIWITQLHRLVEQRTRQLQNEISEREAVERERSLEAERSRIARDLHDDLGASLTEIAVLASKGQHTSPAEQGVMTLFHAIVDKARELVSALDGIVWAVDPKDNSLQSVADYLCDFADDYLSPSGIACRFDVPVSLPAIGFGGRRKHELFLAVKETLNNIVRHAAATEVEFRLAVLDDELKIVIVDNGRGFDANSRRNGCGLKNLPLRLSRIGGHYEIQSTAGKGTMVEIGLRLSGRADSENKRDD